MQNQDPNSPKKVQEGNPNILELDPVMRIISGYLTPEDQSNFQSTCSEANNTINRNENSIWKNKFKISFPNRYTKLKKEQPQKTLSQEQLENYYKNAFQKACEEEYATLTTKQKKIFTQLKLGLVNRLFEKFQFKHTNSSLRKKFPSLLNPLSFIASKKPVFTLQDLLAEDKNCLNIFLWLKKYERQPALDSLYTKIIQADTTNLDKDKKLEYAILCNQSQEIIQGFLSGVPRWDKETNKPRIARLFLIAAGYGNLQALNALSQQYEDNLLLYCFNDETNPHSTKETPLHLAALNGHTKTVKKLLALLKNKETAINVADNAGRTPLHLAARAGHTEIVTKLLKSDKFDVNAIDNEGQTPLHHAVRAGHTETVTELLKNEKVSVNERDFKRRTSLHEAARRGHTNIVKQLLVKENINVNAADNEGRTPLHGAVSLGHTDIVKQLLSKENIKKNINVNAINNEGRTPLHYAVYRGHTNIVEQLLNKENINVNATSTERRRTPLHDAASHGHTDIVEQLLVKEKINVNATDWGGKTPLELAASFGHTDIVKILLKHYNHNYNTMKPLWSIPSCHIKNKEVKALLELYRYIDQRSKEKQYIARIPLLPRFFNHQLNKSQCINEIILFFSETIHAGDTYDKNTKINAAKRLIQKLIDGKDINLTFKEYTVLTSGSLGDITKPLLKINKKPKLLEKKSEVPPLRSYKK